MKNSVRLALWSLACLIFGGASVNAQQNISTVIGGGPVSLPATGSSVGGPVAVRFDVAGNMYVLDNKYSRILKVNVATNVVSVYAGNGTTGYSGDGLLAVNAQMNQPSGMCIDPATGNLFVADSDNNVIREVTAADGIMHTFAGVQTLNGSFGGDGGAATLAHFHFPDGCAFDSKGNMYIADRANNEVRVIIGAIGATVVPPFGITGAQGTIQNFAGIGGAGPASPASGYQTDGMLAKGGGVYGPFDVVVDANDNVYYADLGNNFDANNNPDPVGSGLPNNNNVVREVTAVDGKVHTVAGVPFTYTANPPAPYGAALTTPLNQPKGLSIDSAGNLYFCDAANQVVVKISGGNLVVVAGTLGHSGFAGDGHAATSANLSFPAGSTIDANGNLFIADVDSNAVRIVPLLANYTVSTPDVLLNNIATLAGNGHASYGGDGAAVTAAELNSPAGLAVDNAGNLYIADSGSDLIRQAIASTSKMSATPLAGQPEAPGFTNDVFLGTAPTDFGLLNAAIAVATDATGNVYIADTANCIVRKRTATGITTIAGVEPTINNVNNPSDITPHCGFTSQGSAAVGTMLGNIQGVALDSKGNVFFSDSTNGVIWEVPTTTTGALIANNAYVIAGTPTLTGFSGDGNPAAQAKLSNPMGIYIDIYDNLFIADAGNHRIREVPALNVGSTMTAGSIYTIAGNGTAGISTDPGIATSAKLQYPYAIVVDHDENVFFSDTTFNLFPTGTHTFSSQTIREVVGTTSGSKTAGNIYTVAGTPNAAGFSGDGGAATSAHLNFPTGLALVPNGPSGPNATANLLISDSINNRVRSVASIANVEPPALSATVNPTSLTFASTTVGVAAATQTVTFANTGAGVVNVSGITFSGANAGDYTETDNCVSAVGGITPLTGTCTITVTFKPTAAGASAATMNVADNVPGSPQTVGLSGTGTAAALALTVKADAPSQTVTAGATATYNLSVTSNQTTNVTATITCTGAPTAATCSAAPASVTVAPTTGGTFKVSVSTTARGELLPFNQPSTKLQPPSFLQIAPMASIALLFLIAIMLGWMQNEAGRARTLRVALSLALILMPIAAATVLVGCGGGSSSTTPPPPTGTPAGTYTLTVTATSGSTTANTTLTLVVN